MAGSNNSSRGYSYPWAAMPPGLFARTGTAGPLKRLRATVMAPTPITQLTAGARTGQTTNKK